ncbi:MAG: AAA family ATPase [Verrucomicrobiales bacterium]|nr:AAA family ATPase [Verrucomicrobiales bacterium]
MKSPFPQKKKKNAPIGQFLADESLPVDHRREILKMNLLEPTPESNQLMDEIIAVMKNQHAESAFLKKNEQLATLIKELESGPLRAAVFISVDGKTAQVMLEDGLIAFSVVPNEKLAKSLRKGDRVLVDGRARAILRRAPAPLKIGDEAVFERRVNGGYVEVTLRGQEKCVFYPTQDLEEKIESGEVEPGAKFIVNARQSIAIDALPPEDGFSSFKFLVNEPVPDVLAERDIGNPPAIIQQVAQHVDIEMNHPELRREFGLPRSLMALLTGIPGTGKTLSIEAIWKKIYEIMSEKTGVPIEELPPRVFRLRMSKILSEWLGRSDKNVDRLFDEISQLANQAWIAPDGSEHDLPALVILEEIDGIAKMRGQDSIFDRILTGILQRLDPNRPDVRDNLVIYLSTSNLPEAIDVAALRRVGGIIEKFGRLDRDGFRTVLEKQISRLPIKGGPEPVVAGLTAWLFSPNGSDPGVIELDYTGSTNPDKRYRRDFLTGALINRAVRQASEAAATEAYEGKNGSGIHLEHFVESMNRQILATADQISAHNADRFIEIPDSARVANVRRIPQPDLFPLQLQTQPEHPTRKS